MPITQSKIQSDFHFKTLKDGTKIFYPQGPLGRRGYYISSPELEPKLRQDIRRFYKRQILWSGILGAFAGPLAMVHVWAFILIIGCCSCLGRLRAHLYFAKYTKEMKPAHIPNSPVAHWLKWGKTGQSSSLLGYMLLFLVLLVGSIWLYPITKNPTMLVCSAVFTLMLVPGGIAIYGKLYKKRTH